MGLQPVWLVTVWVFHLGVVVGFVTVAPTLERKPGVRELENLKIK